MQTFEEFKRLSEGANLVPVVRKLIADLETPVSVLARLVDDENVFLLESVEAGERFGRYSFIGLNPRGVFSVEEGRAYYADADGKRELDAPEGPFMALRGLLKGIRPAVVPELPPLFGGAVGYLGYETVREFERLPEPKPGLDGPTSAMLITDEMIIFDNVRHTMMLSVCVRPGEFGTLKEAYDHAVRRLDAISERLRRPAAAASAGTGETPELVSNCGRETYMEMVKKARRHIYDGDIIQVVLSQKFTAETDMLSRLHLLMPISPKVFHYLAFSPDGKKFADEYRKTSGTIPMLMRDPDTGIVTLLGGETARAGVDFADPNAGLVRVADLESADDAQATGNPVAAPQPAKDTGLVDLGQNL